MKQHLSFREVHPPQLYAHPSIKQLTTALALKAATWGDRHTIKQTIENTTDYGSCNSLLKVKLADSLIMLHPSWQMMLTMPGFGCLFGNEG